VIHSAFEHPAFEPAPRSNSEALHRAGTPPPSFPHHRGFSLLISLREHWLLSYLSDYRILFGGLFSFSFLFLFFFLLFFLLLCFFFASSFLLFSFSFLSYIFLLFFFFFFSFCVSLFFVHKHTAWSICCLYKELEDC